MGAVKYFSYLLVITLMLNCGTNKKASENSQVLSGKIITKPFVNKIGKEVGDDYYIETNNKTYLISLSRSKVSLDEIKRQLGKEVTFEGEIAYGNEVQSEEIDGIEVQAQSRVLEYIVIFKFM